MQHFKILEDESNDNQLVLEGYIALFGGEDLTGEHFTSETNFESSYTRKNAVLIDWEHGQEPDDVKAQPGRDDVLGTVDWLTARQDDIGLLARHVLDRRERYVSEFVEPLAKAKLLGSSSEAIPKTIQREPDGRITVWELKRQALTVNPAEPRLLTENQMQIIKSLADTYPQLKSLLLTDGQEAVEDDSEPIEEKVIENGETNMSEKTKDADEVVEPTEHQKAVNDRLDKMDETLEKVVGVLETIPEKTVKRVIVERDSADKALEENPFKSAGDFYMEVRKAAEGRQYDERLKPLKTEIAKEGVVFALPEVAAEGLKAPTGLSESVPADGGFLVGTDRREGVMMRDYATGQVWNRAMNIPIGANANGTTINALDETSRVSGSRWGGVLGYWLAEADEKTASKPKFRQLEPKLKKVAALVYATDELLQDSTALAGVVNSTVPAELAFQKDNAAIEGSGVGKPLGILNSPALVTVAKESGQAATTLVSANIINMRARRWARGSYVWFINQDVEPQLHQLNLPVGTGGALVYMPPGGLSASPYGTLYGDPVIPIEHCSTLGTVGDIILADMGQYLTISKGGVQSASSIHVRFVYDESVFRFVERVDGLPVWDAPLTPFKGSNTQSPFVALATRS